METETVFFFSLSHFQFFVSVSQLSDSSSFFSNFLSGMGEFMRQVSIFLIRLLLHVIQSNNIGINETVVFIENKTFSSLNLMFPFLNNVALREQELLKQSDVIEAYKQTYLSRREKQMKVRSFQKNLLQDS
jgi:hypothetical protein